MSEHLTDTEREPAEFGVTGVIGLASELAMRLHRATVDTMRTSPGLAVAATATQLDILTRFNAVQADNTWNDLPADTARELFEDFAIRYRGEQ